jgi:hypothetical protein
MFFQSRRSQERAARLAPKIVWVLALAAFVASARPAAAQGVGTNCGSEGIVLCGTVWNDLNGNGIQDAGEPGIGGVEVKVFDSSNTEVTSFFTNADGSFFFTGQTLDTPGNFTVSIDITSVGTGVTASPANQGTDEDSDSDGTDSTTGVSFAAFVVDEFATSHDIDFGFVTSKAAQPGTGTPGYWKNHPLAWPSPYTNGITVGGVFYSKSDAIAILSKPGKDKRATLFSSLVSAMLNVAVVGPGGTHNDDSCVATTITAADAWMASWGVPNTNPIVSGSSAAWADGEPLHKQMDAYNNGLLCAPHRN